MIKVYGSLKCPDCVACKMNFDTFHIEYEFFDVMGSLKNLKQFLIYRDSEPVFDRLKAINDIGIPACIDEDGNVFTDWESYLKDKGFEPFEVNAGQACGIDHKGC
ncbi:MAG: glutaredoxin [Lachnospiraceae bacterium]|nr:glutaredoxin [Lachnospiraceae bacterium]